MAAKKYTEGRGKIDFIRSLQPFFQAREVTFCKALPELESQFRSFPKGAIDGPNALAYALKMRPGLVIYDALYTWCRTLAGERHGWYPEAILKEIHS
jgi:hypothetical protein